MPGFLSDNNAGLCPEALQAIHEANGPHQPAYGDDDYTAAAESELRRIFTEAASVWFVATGTAANTLAIAALTEPWQQVICHLYSHYNHDESTAPERVTHCRTVGLPTDTGKLEPADIARVGRQVRGDVHQPQPGVVTLSNPTEFGTLYTPTELVALCRAAHEAGFRVHVDGARFANAVVALGCNPSALTIDVGIDALSFGGTKNGLAYGEAVLFFPQGDGRVFERATAVFAFHRKAAGHLLSKHRFLTAPFAATLRDGVWLRRAADANRAAARLSEGLVDLGYELRFPTHTNGVFVTMAPEVDRALSERGHAYYRFGDPRWNMFRLMCSFDTTDAQIEGFLADARAALGR